MGSRDNLSDVIRLGRCLSTSKSASNIQKGIRSGAIEYKTLVVGAQVRLDHLAYQAYKTPDLWWIIAAASGIGWGLQIPEGTRVVIPTNYVQALAYARG